MFGQTGGAPDPYDMFRISNQWTKERMQQYPALVQMQLGQLPAITAAQMEASKQAFPLQLQQAQESSQAAFNEQMRQYGIAAPQIAGQNYALMGQYAPGYGEILRGQGRLTAGELQSQMYQFNPEFMRTYSQLGGRIGEGLKAGMICTDWSERYSREYVERKRPGVITWDQLRQRRKLMVWVTRPPIYIILVLGRRRVSWQDLLPLTNGLG
jgi:hypothetical protein